MSSQINPFLPSSSNPMQSTNERTSWIKSQQIGVWSEFWGRTPLMCCRETEGGDPQALLHINPNCCFLCPTPHSPSFASGYTVFASRRWSCRCPMREAACIVFANWFDSQSVGISRHKAHVQEIIRPISHSLTTLFHSFLSSAMSHPIFLHQGPTQIYSCPHGCSNCLLGSCNLCSSLIGWSRLIGWSSFVWTALKTPQCFEALECDGFLTPQKQISWKGCTSALLPAPVYSRLPYPAPQSERTSVFTVHACTACLCSSAGPGETAF